MSGSDRTGSSSPRTSPTAPRRSAWRVRFPIPVSGTDGTGGRATKPPSTVPTPSSRCGACAPTTRASPPAPSSTTSPAPAPPHLTVNGCWINPRYQDPAEFLTRRAQPGRSGGDRVRAGDRSDGSDARRGADAVHTNMTGPTLSGPTPSGPTPPCPALSRSGHRGPPHRSVTHHRSTPRHPAPRCCGQRGGHERRVPRSAPVRFRRWTAPDRIVATVSDRGDGPADPFAGLLPVTDTCSAGWGLWATHQLCGHVTLDTTDNGFTIGLVVGTQPGRSGHASDTA